MKKITFIIATALVLLGVAGYVVYDVLKDDVKPTTNTEVELFERQEDSLNVEYVIAMDKQFMAMQYADYGSYKYFETCILMNDWLDAEVEPGIFGVANIFQVQKKVGKNTSCKVVLTSHNVSVDTIDVRNGFWVEDFDLNELDTVKFITFEEAYKVLMEANVQKPHSKHVVLRKALGPNPEDTYNPQYIFGNADCHYYIDAITGVLSLNDPSGLPEDDDHHPYLFKNIE